MKINSFTDYSLRVLIFLALKNNEKSTVHEISEQYQISQNHLVKVVHNLSKMGLINTSKGRSGGLLLAKKPESIIIGKLIMRLEEESFLVECFREDGSCVINPSCKLKAALIKATKSFYQVLNEYTLKDIISNDKALKTALNLVI